MYSVQCTVHVQWRLAGVEAASEVPEEDCGELAGVVLSGPAQEGLAGEGQVATGVDSQGGGAGGGGRHPGPGLAQGQGVLSLLIHPLVLV